MVTCAVRSEKAEKLKTETITGHLRPQRSAIGPDVIAAIISPIRLDEKIVPKWLTATCIVTAIDGAV